MAAVKSRNNYVVDTKSNCFLCLRAIPTTPPVITLDGGDEDVKPELTEGDKRSENGDSNEDKNNEQKQFWLRSIYRLIKIDPGKVLSKILTGGFNKQLLNTDLIVSLCEECLKVTKRFSSLCLELEAVQMKVNHVLKEFLNVLQSSINDPVDRMALVRGKITDPLDILHVTMADELRKETEKKCRDHLKKSAVLKVNLSNFSSITSPVGHASLLPVPAAENNESLPLPPLSVKVTKKLLVPAFLKCKLCGNAFGSTSGLERHTRRRHPSDVDTISNSFRSILPHVNLVSAHAPPHPPPPPPPRRAAPSNISPTRPKPNCYACKMCGLRMASKPGLKRHKKLYCSFRLGLTTNSAIPPPPPPVVVAPSPPVLTVISPPVMNNNNVITIPETPLEQRLQPLPHVKSDNNILSCSLCPCTSALKFTREDALKTHIITTHPDYIFAPNKSPECSPSLFKDVCFQVINNSLSNSHHQNVSSEGSTLVCAYCSSGYSDKSSLNVHYLQVHFNIFAAKVCDAVKAELGKKIVIPPPTIRSSSQITNVLNQSKSTLPTSSLALKYQCRHCGEIYRHSTSLRRHVRSKHEQTNKLQSSPTSSRQRGNVECQFCGQVLSSTSALYRHQRQNCTQVVETTTFPTDADSADASNLEFFDAEEEMEEEAMDIDLTYPSESFLNPKIEVFEMNHPVTMFPNDQGGNLLTDSGEVNEDNLFLDGLQEVGHEEDIGQIYFEGKKEDPHLLDMLIPDMEDPLLF